MIDQRIFKLIKKNVTNAGSVPISAGTLIHVAASDLIPEANEGERWPVTLAVVLGGVLCLAATLAFGGHGH